MKTAKKRDWVAEVFAAMRDCGEDISIVYGQRMGSAETRWFELPHDEFDGISGLASLLRRQGLHVASLPVLRDDRFSFARAVKGFFAVAPTLGLRLREWRQFDGARAVSFLPVKERVAYRLFTQEQTQEIVRAAKAAGVTVNTYLLFHLDAAVSAQLARASTPRRWMIPVNLRGAVTRDNEDAPHMSFLAVDIERDGSPGAVQSQINQLKARAYHWGSWVALNLGRLVGAKAMRQDLRKREKKSHGWSGIFSNLGVWDVPGAGNWLFGPAISRVHPVGAGCITMNGRMALTVQLHDAFCGDLQTSYALLDAWTQACTSGQACEDSTPNKLVGNLYG
jgi:hypothetical protein